MLHRQDAVGKLKAQLALRWLLRPNLGKTTLAAWWPQAAGAEPKASTAGLSAGRRPLHLIIVNKSGKRSP